MELSKIVLSNFLLFSLLANVYFFRKSRQPKPQKQETYDARALLADLASGGALVKIERIDPNSVFMRSPRELG